VGHAGADDGAVYRLSDDVAVVQTIDFFTPILDDPFDFGRAAAANALSDVYAMGGVPRLALNVVCFPDEDLDADVLGEVLRGGQVVVREAGAVVGGGHSVSDKEFKYGLSVMGTVHPDRVWTNAGARPGDVLVLTKPVGTGVLATAAKRGALDAAGTTALVECVVTLNRAAAEAGREAGGVHAATDITGYGLVGHAAEMARASGARLRLDAGAVPLLPGARRAAERGHLTRGETTNAAYVAGDATFEGVDGVLRSLLLDPQTSGGLLLAVDPDRVEALLGALRGAPCAAVIGRVEAGAGVTVGP